MNNKIKILLLFSFLLITVIFIPQKSFALENLFSVDANTISLWRFNEVSGNTVIDSTGINNGTAIGTSIVDGKFGKARYFNGVNEYIAVPDNPSLDNLSQITIEVWVYPQGFDLGCWNQDEGLIVKGDNRDFDVSNAYGIWITRNSDTACGSASVFNQVRFGMQFGSTGNSSGWHSPNQWYYIVGTYDGANLKLYVNGVFEGFYSGTSPIIANSRDLYINHHTWSWESASSQRMQGIIDEIRISNIARSAEEISYYYNLATGQNIIPSLSNLGQFKSDATTTIPEGGITTESTVVFKATLADPDNDQIKLQVELKEKDQDFNEQDIIESSFVNSGSEVVITKQNLTDGQYHWRARAIDDKGNASEWQRFGQSGFIFSVNSVSASIIAQQLNSDNKTPPDEVFWYVQGLGNNLSGTLRSFQIYGESDRSGSWQAGICAGSGWNCSTLTASNENIITPGIKTLLTFNLSSPLQLVPGIEYGLYVRPWTGANFNYSHSSLYGSIFDDYALGSLLSYQRIPGWGGWVNYSPGISDAYFILSTTQLVKPSITGITQLKSDGVTPISEGGITTENEVIFQGQIDSQISNQVKLQVELRQVSEPFTGIDDGGILNSDFVNSGSIATINKTDLPDGQYHWRARAIDDKGNASDWQEFGTAGNVDFEVKLPLSYKAAKLAKELIDYPYLLGGKGWDYNQNEFIALSTIRAGYNFWNQKLGSVAFGAGVDCSGLVMWSYNRSFDPLKSRFNNFVKAEGADEQFRENTATTTEPELQPGDVMFFDNVPKNGFIDHTAMYVGDSGDFDVVSAVDRTQGILGVFKNTLKQSPKFVAFKRVVSAVPLAMLTTSHSPVDLVVTDPDEFTITPTTTIPSDLEYLRQIPGVLYYSEMERGPDGNPIDQVYSYTAKTGDYIIQVLPEPGTPSTAAYTLDFSANGQSVVLADNVPISQIPSQGYGITTSATGAINSFIPVAIDIKPGSYPNSINLKSNGVVPVAILGSATFDVKQINPITIKLANAPVKLKGNGQPMISYEDINGDSFTDIVAHVITKDLQLTPSDIKANLEGKLIDGTVIKSLDSVRIVP